jgi:hypothetical protein
MLPRHFRRFSLRFLLFLPVVFAVLFTCRSLTMTKGVEDVGQYVAATWVTGSKRTPQYCLPLVLDYSIMYPDYETRTLVTDRRYYLWLFGYVRELPFERRHVDPIPRGRRSVEELMEKRLGG